jgi:putative nucleotidyltransferase with HDIG domain
MGPTLRLSPYGRRYLWGVIIAGIAVITLSVVQLSLNPIGSQWLIIAALTLISGSATVRLPSSYASISISETFVFTAVLLYGPAAGTAITALDGLVISFWLAKRHREPHRALFNMAAPAVSVWCSAHLFFFVSGVPPLTVAPSSINTILPALVVFAVSCFALNSWLITFIIALERRVSPITIWRSSFLWWSMNYFCGASVAILFVGFNREIDLGYIGIILPILLVMYATFKTSLSRIEDADKHVHQMNQLYLSTIETLAMAIDAKDQVTHGHIRRVQSYAVGLAKEIGVRDDKLLKALEAAALLHDMGKLAVPEYILNKPGKLTEAEFEKMKLHASVGADILSAIDFPYPVVPIVRHHHENWNGTGYPAGLTATDIPLGARILAVVDCFDALTSDRPYRPQLSDEQAIEILLQRRGTMYDPLVVDSFIRVYRFIGPTAPSPEAPKKFITEIVSARRSIPSNTGRSAPTNEGPLEDLASIAALQSALSKEVTIADSVALTAIHLGRIGSSALFIVFSYDVRADELVATHLFGASSLLFRDLRIHLGQRLSGWVAANRQTIRNSDPMLDLSDIASRHDVELHSCLAAPMLNEDQLYGVLGVYAKDADAFTKEHQDIVEAAATHIAELLAHTRRQPDISMQQHGVSRVTRAAHR